MAYFTLRERSLPKGGILFFSGGASREGHFTETLFVDVPERSLT